MDIEHCLLALERKEALEDEQWLQALLTDILELDKLKESMKEVMNNANGNIESQSRFLP